ncbi:MAG: HTTM domain-containing protein, partial [Bdellovibrionales bacterium]|nr:HTTM domain-containing protein [Bdellovibrionales bacterium]
QVVFPWFFFTDSSLIGRAILSLGILGGVSICFGRFSRRWLIYVWVVLCSLQARNPLVVHAGDGWLRILVFLAALLPLDREQLIKVSAGKMNSQLVESPYAFLVIGQLVLIYFVAGASKLWNGWWDGRGIYNAFHLLIYAKSLAKYIREWPTEVLSIFNWMILIMELVISHLLWCSGKWWRFRIIAILVFLIFHLSCLFVLELGFLPWVGIIHLLLLFPSQFWDLLPDWFSVEEQATDLAFSQGQRALISLVYFLFLSL